MIDEFQTHSIIYILGDGFYANYQLCVWSYSGCIVSDDHTNTLYLRFARRRCACVCVCVRVGFFVAVHGCKKSILQECEKNGGQKKRRLPCAKIFTLISIRTYTTVARASIFFLSAFGSRIPHTTAHWVPSVGRSIAPILTCPIPLHRQPSCS